MTEKTTSVILSLLILAGIIYFAFISFKTKPFPETAKETIVTLVKTIPIKNGYAGYYEFLCNDKQVQAHGGGTISWSVLGEKYKALIDTSNCEILIVQGHRPVFLAHEDIDTTIGTITLSTSFVVNPLIKFDYYVGDKLYTKLQYMEEGYQKTYPKLREGAQLQVEYWLEDPQRAIMHFEKQ